LQPRLVASLVSCSTNRHRSTWTNSYTTAALLTTNQTINTVQLFEHSPSLFEYEMIRSSDIAVVMHQLLNWCTNIWQIQYEKACTVWL